MFSLNYVKNIYHFKEIFSQNNNNYLYKHCCQSFGINKIILISQSKVQGSKKKKNSRPVTKKIHLFREFHVKNLNHNNSTHNKIISCF